MMVPLTLAWRRHNGKVEWALGAGMFVNTDGWIITAGHILQQVLTLGKQVETNQKKRRLRSNDIADAVLMVGQVMVEQMTARIEAPVDLGVAQTNIRPSDSHVFPRFRGRDVKQGELLCRAGYPFLEELRPKWSKDDGFIFDGLFPVPMFVNEALVSRFNKLVVNGNDAGIWIETSSPGLKGQSGGPLADVDGLICGIQVQTHHYPLGFKGRARNQFLNVGRAAHSETVRHVLDKYGVTYQTEEN